MPPRSATRPPSAELLELDLATAVVIDGFEGGANLDVRETGAEGVQQLAQLGLIDLAVAVPVHTLEAVSQRIATHAVRIRWLSAASNRALLLALGVLACSCRGASQPEPPPAASSLASAAEVPPEPRLSEHSAEPGPSVAPSDLAPLTGEWLLRVETPDATAFVAPPAGATAPRPVIVAIHGAGDRPEWSCGGWRLASLVSSFVVCPQGQKLGPQTFAWASPQQLGERVEAALAATRAKFDGYLQPGAMIFAGFSQGATLAEPFLRANAGRFPIAILAEGGYATARSPSFARAYQAGGGRRIVLVCGTPHCFTSAVAARKVLETAGVEALVVGDPKAGHNLNDRMQKALQAAWPEMSAPPHDLRSDH